MKAIEKYIQAWKKFELNKDLLVSGIIDLLTIALLLFIYGTFSRFVKAPLQIFFIQLGNPDASALGAFGLLMLVYIVSHFAVYLTITVLQPIAWKRFHKIKCFSKLMLPWILVFFFINIYRDIFSLSNIILQIDILGQSFIDYSYTIMLLMLVYFILISFSRNLNLNESFIAGFSYNYLVGFILVSIGLVILHFIIGLIGQSGEFVNIIASILLFIPYLTWIRIYYLELAN